MMKNMENFTVNGVINHKDSVGKKMGNGKGRDEGLIGNVNKNNENGDKNVENAKEKVSECSVTDPEVQRKECDGGVVSSVEEFPTLQEVFNKGCELNSSNSNNSNSINVDNNSVNSEENNVNSAVGMETNDNRNSNRTIENDAKKLNYKEVMNPYAQNIDNKLLEIPTVFEDGREVVVFEEELVFEGSKKWMLTLCGRFVGMQMNYNELKYNIRRMWGRHGLSDIVMQNGVYLFKFKNEEGMQFVLESGTWMVNNKPMLIQKWDPTVIIDKSDPKKLPLWVKLYNIPLEAWSVKGISAISFLVA
ncbi:RNA-directed DNA polymerase, eukaryota, reverse transcriptase zinc-binding domain protein [Tanacetum coccineum]